MMKVYECENIEDNILLYFGKYLYYQLYFDLDICNILKWVFKKNYQLGKCWIEIKNFQCVL